MKRDARVALGPSIPAQLIGYFFLIVLGVAFILPFAWIVSTAFKPATQVLNFPPIWIPKPITLKNFSEGWAVLPFTTYLINTVVVTALATAGTVLSSSIVAYGFARFRARDKKVLFAILLSTMMLPSQVTLIPTYVLYNYLGWLNTFKPLVLPAYFGVGAFYIFLLRQFFRSIPKELAEAATIDGYGSFRILYRIFMPLSKPALTTVVIFCIINTWNDFLNQLIYLNSDSRYTIAVGLSFFNSKYGPQQINLLMAVSLLTITPIIVLFFAAQKYFVQGIVTSGLKG